MKSWIVFFSVVLFIVGVAGCRKLDSVDEGGSGNNSQDDDDVDDADDDDVDDADDDDVDDADDDVDDADDDVDDADDIINPVPDWESLCADNCKLIFECHLGDDDFDSVAECTDACLDSTDDFLDRPENSECEQELVVVAECQNALNCDEFEDIDKNCGEVTELFYDCVEDNLDDDEEEKAGEEDDKIASSIKSISFFFNSIMPK